MHHKILKLHGYLLLYQNHLKLYNSCNSPNSVDEYKAKFLIRESI